MWHVSIAANNLNGFHKVTVNENSSDQGKIDYCSTNPNLL